MSAVTTEPARELRRVRPKRGAPQDTRARLVAAAAEAFNRHGFHRIDSNRIARDAGYAAGTFYKHFADKRAAFLAAYEAWVTTEWTAIGAELATRRPARELAVRIAELVLEHHRRWRGLRASMAALLVEDGEVRAFHRAQRRRQIALLEHLRSTPPTGDDSERVRDHTARTAEDDALLLFTLERTCDAIASGEAEDLGLDRDRLLALLRAQIEQALSPAGRHSERGARGGGAPTTAERVHPASDERPARGTTAAARRRGKR
ncbi:TetR/AcrR family transcriptional regulator [Candidatus Binatia bacterium]|nr:TetR/AcrR family transcriptional regulator [Candidatus Binatia bacterium]